MDHKREHRTPPLARFMGVGRQHNPSSELLIDLDTLLFLNQQVSTPTRKSNVLDLIFCSDELIKNVDVSECSFSDHCLIKTET